MWLVAALLDSADIGHLHHYRKFYCTMLQEDTLITLISHRVLHSLVPTHLSRFVFYHTHLPAPLYSASNPMFFWLLLPLVWDFLHVVSFVKNALPTL